jgi:hypothetical protein
MARFKNVFWNNDNNYRRLSGVDLGQRTTLNHLFKIRQILINEGRLQFKDVATIWKSALVFLRPKVRGHQNSTRVDIFFFTI